MSSKRYNLMTMPTIHRTLATTALCLATVAVNSCQQMNEVEYEIPVVPYKEMPILDYFPLDGQE